MLKLTSRGEPARAASAPFNPRREPCPQCAHPDSFVQQFAEHAFESFCMLCGYVQPWAEQVRVSGWKTGIPVRPKLEVVAR